MLDAAEAGQHDVVIVHKLDRFARSLMVTLRELKRLEEHRVGFVSLSESMDFTTPIGRVILATLAAFAEYYSRNLSTEVRKGIVEKREQGEHVGGIPWGALRREGKLAIDPAHAETLALLLELARDRSPQAVATELNRRAIPPPRTGAWWPETVRGIVRHGAWLAEQPEPWPARWREAAKRPPCRASPTRAGRRASCRGSCAARAAARCSTRAPGRDPTAPPATACAAGGGRTRAGSPTARAGGTRTPTSTPARSRRPSSRCRTWPTSRACRAATGVAAREEIGRRRQSLVLALAEGLPAEQYYRRKAARPGGGAAAPGGRAVRRAAGGDPGRAGRLGALTPAQKNAIWRLLFEKVVARGRDGRGRAGQGAGRAPGRARLSRPIYVRNQRPLSGAAKCHKANSCAVAQYARHGSRWCAIVCTDGPG
jgi:hypothetical protein